MTGNCDFNKKTTIENVKKVPNGSDNRQLREQAKARAAHRLSQLHYIIFI